MFVIAFVCGVLAVLVLLLTPIVDERPVHAQVLAARILYDGGLGPQPGVISEEQFLARDDTRDLISFRQTEIYRIGARARVLDINTQDELFTHHVYYNRPAYEILAGQSLVFTGHERKVWAFPVALERTTGEREPALIELEVIYATR